MKLPPVSTRLAFAALLAGACARTPPPAPPAPPDPDSLVADSVARADSLAREALLGETRPRHAVRPLPLSRAFQRAIENGTRTPDGRKGPRYWQQGVEYRIEAEIDPANARVQGIETLTYHNRSPDTLDRLVFHLYQNLFAPGVQRVRRVPVTGGVTLERVAVAGREAVAERDYDVSGTLMTLRLPQPLPPGGRVSVEIAWRFTVPPAGAPRTGHDRREAYVVAQWYPQVATYDDLRGWHTTPYWGNGEFYLEYGSFDVAITAPEGWVVAATGELDNPDEVLSDETRARLARALATESVTTIAGTDDLAAGDVTTREPGGVLTWRFRARNVRDFAFATSDRYLWDAARATLPDADGDGDPERVLVNALYRPSATTWSEAAEFLRDALTFHAQRWHPYPYSHLTATEGPIGGMEYPMLVFIGAPADSIDLYEVLSHEAAHQWWAMLVGSNESDHAWQDEGLATYVENLSVEARFPDADPHGESSAAYLGIAGTEVERPIFQQPDLYGPGPQYGIATYHKPATLYRALEAIIGERTLHAALRVYADRWLLAHPAPFDLLNTIEDVAGRDLGWFWTPWFRETEVLDQAIHSVETTPLPDGAGERVTVIVEDRGGAPMPVLLEVSTATESRSIELPVEPWLEGRIRQAVTVDLAAPVTRVEIDPGKRFPDVNRSDNVWERG